MKETLEVDDIKGDLKLANMELHDKDKLQGLQITKSKNTEETVPNQVKPMKLVENRICLRPLGELIGCDDINNKRTSTMWHIPPATSPSSGEEATLIKQPRAIHKKVKDKRSSELGTVRKKLEVLTNPTKQLFARDRVVFTLAGQPLLAQSIIPLKIFQNKTIMVFTKV